MAFKKKEMIIRIFGWLDIEAIKNVLGGLSSCKAWMVIWKIVVDSLCDAYKYSRKWSRKGM